MFKFFRKIRQRLLTQSKFSRYLIYAFGEIFLVVIGILIALSVNTWNANRISKEKEQIILKDLRSEVVSNLEALDVAISQHESSFDATKEIQYLFQHREIFNKMPDSAFRSLYLKMYINYTFNPSTGILKSMISSGQIDNLSNNELKYLLAALQDIFIDASESTLKLDELRHDISIKFNSEAFEVRNGEIHGKNYKNYFDKPYFRTLVGNYFIFRKEGIQEENDLKETMLFILKLIDEEMTKEK